MPLHVHLWSLPYAADLAAFPASLHPDITLTMGEQLPDTAVSISILIAGYPSRTLLTQLPNLHTLIIPWAGLPQTTGKLLADFPQIAVYNLHHNATPVAEQTLALLLAAARAIVPADRALRQGNWWLRYERPGPAVLLAGKTALILGYGAIGQKVAPLCQALGMQVLAVRRQLETAVQQNGIPVYPVTALPDLLPQANALLICLPLTAATTGLIGAAELALLPPKAILVNIGRGPIVDEAALYTALHTRQLHAAALDVWYTYPPDEASRAHTLPSRYPFHELDNVVMSPHRAGGVDTLETLRLAHLAELLHTVARGESLPNRIDLQQGY